MPPQERFTSLCPNSKGQGCGRCGVDISLISQVEGLDVSIEEPNCPLGREGHESPNRTPDWQDQPYVVSET